MAGMAGVFEEGTQKQNTRETKLKKRFFRLITTTKQKHKRTEMRN